MWTYWISEFLERLAVDRQQDVSLLDPPALLGRLVREQLLYPDQGVKIPRGRIQLAHQETEAEAAAALSQGHFLGVY